jgi:hypothetical protein
MAELKEITTDLLRSTYGSKLQGEENYITWSLRMQNILENAGCWEVVHQETILPELLPLTIAPLKTDATDADRKAYQTAKDAHDLSQALVEKKIKEIQQVQAKAHFHLKNGVEDHILCQIADIQDPHKIWTTLKEMFAAALEDRRALLQKKLNDMGRFAPRTSSSSY